MKSQSIIQASLQALSEHRALIEEAYVSGSISRTVENARDITVLQQYRILIADGRDEFHLSGFLTKFLDVTTQKQRLYETLGEDIEVLHERIHKLRHEYTMQLLSGRSDELDVIVGQFQDACNDLADSITHSLSRLLVQTETRFGVAATLAAKMRQNEHFLKQAENLSRGLGVLERSEDNFGALYEGDPLHEDLNRPYDRLVTSRLREWSSEVLRIVNILRAYLFRLRQMEPDVRRLRDFADFLHQNPAYDPPDLTDNRNLPSWLRYAPGIKIQSHPDIEDDSCIPELEAIALKLPTVERNAVTKRESGKFHKPSRTEKVKVSAPPETRALIKYVAQALKSETPLPAREWFREEGEGLGVSEDLWLFLLLSCKERDYPPFNRAIFQMVEFRGLNPLSKNIFVRDILVHGKKAR